MLQLIAHMWVLINTHVHARRATEVMVMCVYQLTPARKTLEIAPQHHRFVNMMDLDR